VGAFFPRAAVLPRPAAGNCPALGSVTAGVALVVVPGLAAAVSLVVGLVVTVSLERGGGVASAGTLAGAAVAAAF
jgi:hypothetical protein